MASGNRFARTGPGDNLEAIKALSTLHKVVTKRAQSIAQVEWVLYNNPNRRPGRVSAGAADDRIPIPNHPALDVWERPNAHTTRTQFLTRWSLHRDLAGEAFIAPDKPNQPAELWQYRPDRMAPRPDPNKYLLGWTYTDPDGRKHPFDTNEIWSFIDPSPTSEHRGCSPIDALMADVAASKQAAIWNLSFFENYAQLGGILEVPDGLTDDEFDDLARRVTEQHRGSRNAGSLLVLEHGKYKPNTMSMRDMQFEALRNLTRDIVREAYAMPKTLLGIGESVNRATAEAAWAIYLQQEITARLVELREWLNREFLPRYRAVPTLEFDFVDPVPLDKEAANADLTAKVNAAVALIGLGLDHEQVLEAVELPALDMAEEDEPEPPPQIQAPAPAEIGPGEDDDEETEEDESGRGRGPEDRRRRLVARFRAQDDPPERLDSASDLPDVRPLQANFRRTLDRLFDQWDAIEDKQKAELVALVRQIVASGDLTQLEQLDVDTGPAVDALVGSMSEMAEDGAQAIVREAAEQDVEVTAAAPDESVIREAAVIVAGLTAARLIASAKTTALRTNSRTATPDTVAAAVEAALEDLSKEGPRPQLSGALTGSQNDGRINTIRRAPSAAIYANEVNDENTCGPCRAIDGKWLGNTEDLAEIRELYPGGAFGGYVDCDGRERCRGTLSAVFRPQTVNRN